jgi:hypothetical protein
MLFDYFASSPRLDTNVWFMNTNRIVEKAQNLVERINVSLASLTNFHKMNSISKAFSDKYHLVLLVSPLLSK